MSQGPGVNAPGKPQGHNREGGDCKAALTQLAAASKAVDRAVFSVIATGLEVCLAQEDSAADREELEKLFMSLAQAGLPGPAAKTTNVICQIVRM